MRPALATGPTKPLRACLGLYFWLLLLEGVFRKWIFPEYSDVFFLIRDPLVVLIYVLAAASGVFPHRLAMLALWLIAVASLLVSLATEAPVLVTMFGFRTNYLHLPLVFVMAQVMDRNDVLRVGRWAIAASVPILLLMLVQFNADPGSWVNATAGAGEGQQLRGAMGKIRPPGPFSFVTGTVAFFSLVSAYVCAGWLNKQLLSRRWLVVGSLTLLLAIPMSISRSLLMGVLTTLAFACFATMRDSRQALRLAGVGAVAILLLGVLWKTVLVQAFVVRWEEAGNSGFYDSVISRMIEFYLAPFTIEQEVPLTGYGLGVGTVAGARLMSGRAGFLLGESELPRILLELGPIVGWAFILWRVWLGGALLRSGWLRVREEGDVLPWLLTGVAFPMVIWAQWGPATQLGFSVYGAGLVFASLNRPDEVEVGVAGGSRKEAEESIA